MDKKYSLTSIIEPCSCQLRKDFESFEGTLVKRDINISKTTKEIKDLKYRPEYSPHIRLFQGRRLSPDLIYVFTEIIYLSNEFLVGFEEFIKEKSLDIHSSNYGVMSPQKVPGFLSGFILVPGHMERMLCSQLENNEDSQSLAVEKIEGMSHTSSRNLMMLEQKIMYDKFEEIEEKADFYAVIEKIERIDSKNNTDIISLEYSRHPNHLIFRE